MDDASPTWPRGLLLTALLSTAGCATLAVLWQIVPAWQSFDAVWLERIHTHTPDVLATALKLIGYGGSLFVAIPLAVGLALYLWSRRQRARALLWAAAFLGGQLTVFVLKLSVDRVRPTAPGLLERAFSFPSGHAFTSVLLYGGIVLFCQPWRSRWMRWLVILVAGGLALAVGWSRLIRRVHYPTDVLGGWLLGIAGLALLGAALQRWASTGAPGRPVSSSTRSSR